MKYEEPNMWIIALEDNDIPITMASTVEEGNPFDDWDDSGMPDE